MDEECDVLECDCTYSKCRMPRKEIQIHTHTPASSFCARFINNIH